LTDRFHPITHPIHRPVPGDKADDNPDVAFVQRADVNPDAGGIHGAFQHVAIFKNILVAADGDKSARLRVFDVRDWSEKQVIRVGAVSEATTGDSSGGGGPAPAAVTSLAFDGTTIACGTAEGHAHTWRLAELEGKRGYVRLLQPLRVDSQPVTRLSLATEANLLTAYSPTKRTLVVWNLESGKLHAAYSVDGVAKGTPLRFTANVESVTACVHAFTDEDDPHGERGVLAALLDVKTGEGGAVVGVREVTAGEGEPRCLTFDGELLCVGTSGGAVIAWNVGEAYAPWKGYHAGEVGCVANVPGDKARIVSGGADRKIILWDAKGNAQARMEVGSPVTAIHAPSPRLALAGTEDGTVEVVALCDGDVDADEALTASCREGKRRSNELTRYSPKFDASGASKGCESFEAFTRTFKVKEGAYTAPPPETEKKTKAETAKDKKIAEAMMKGMGETEAEKAERKKREDEEEAAKHRAMDGAGVARDPSIKSSTEGMRRCSNPRCIEREDTIAGKMLRCSRCKSAFYCSSHCQRTHWRDGHKASCAPAGTAAQEASSKSAPAPAPPAPPPQRRQLVIEDDSEDESSDEEEEEEETEVKAAEPSPAVVREESKTDVKEPEPSPAVVREEPKTEVKEPEPAPAGDGAPADDADEEPLVLRPRVPTLDADLFADLDLDPEELAGLQYLSADDDIDIFESISSRPGTEHVADSRDDVMRILKDLECDDIDMDEDEVKAMRRAMEDRPVLEDRPALPPWMTTHAPGSARSMSEPPKAAVRPGVSIKVDDSTGSVAGAGDGDGGDAPSLPPWMTTHKPGATPVTEKVRKEEEVVEAPEVAGADSDDDDPLYDLD
jgi:WD40 repeat protein